MCGLALWLAGVYSLLCARDLRAEIASFVFNLCPAVKFCLYAHPLCANAFAPKSLEQIALQMRGCELYIAKNTHLHLSMCLFMTQSLKLVLSESLNIY